MRLEPIDQAQLDVSGDAFVRQGLVRRPAPFIELLLAIVIRAFAAAFAVFLGLCIRWLYKHLTTPGAPGPANTEVSEAVESASLASADSGVQQDENYIS